MKRVLEENPTEAKRVYTTISGREVPVVVRRRPAKGKPRGGQQ